MYEISRGDFKSYVKMLRKNNKCAAMSFISQLCTVIALSALSKFVSLQLSGIFQLSESMMKVSKFGLCSDTSASTKSSMVGRLCSIPVEQTHKAVEDACPRHISLWEGKSSSGGTFGGFCAF